jgi:hypothetical protein
MKRKNKNSCIALTGFICNECQNDMFMSIFYNIYTELIKKLSSMPAYKNGKEVTSVIEKVLEINKRDIPYFEDLGHIAKMRMAKFKKEEIRIKQGLLEVEQYQSDKKNSKFIQQLINDHPNLTKDEIFSNFDTTLNKLVTKISQMKYLIPELSRFVEECLMDEAFSILDGTEKETLLGAYIQPFDRLTQDIITYLKEYEKIIDIIVERLKEIKEDIKLHLTEYMSAAFDMKARSAAIATNFVASGLIGFVAREAATRVLAGFLVGGGVVSGVLIAVTFVQAKRKWDQAKKKNEESINTKKIAGINSTEEAEEEMKKVEDFIDQIIKDLELNNMTLKEVCQEEKSRNFQLINKIEDVMEKKVNGKKFQVDDRVKLIQNMKVAQNNLERFKQSI